MTAQSKLKWRCRRGTKELDILLDGFLSRRYARLSSTNQDVFAFLLEEQDPVILDWIWGRGTIPSEQVKTVIELIREDAGIN